MVYLKSGDSLMMDKDSKGDFSVELLEPQENELVSIGDSLVVEYADSGEIELEVTDTHLDHFEAKVVGVSETDVVSDGEIVELA